MSKWQSSGCETAYSCEELDYPGIMFGQGGRFGNGTGLRTVSIARVKTTWGWHRTGFCNRDIFQKVSELQPIVFLIPRNYVFYPLDEDMKACMEAYPDAVFASEI
jgi:hypothetical protein